MGGESKATHGKLYINVMELLVAEEVDRQLASLPERVSKYIKRTEVETFALNRLPALYASSEKGLKHQYDRALKEYKNQILSAVRQAFAAVQVDPIRLSQPLHFNSEEEAVLEALKELLNSPDLTWESALEAIRQLQRRRNEAGTSVSPALSQKSPAPNPASSPAATRVDSFPEHSTAWRPGTYGSRISWKPRRSSYSGDGFGDNPR